MKKILLITLSAVLILSVVGCGNSNNITPTPTPKPAATTKVTATTKPSAAPQTEQSNTQDTTTTVNTTSSQQSSEGTLGLTTSVFVSKCNANCAAIDAGITINSPSYEDNSTAYITTSKSGISFNTVMKNGYIQTLGINYTLTADSAENYITYTDVVLASAYAVDSSIDSQGFSAFLDDLLSSGQSTENVYNGFKYRVDLDADYITVSIRK